MPSKQEWENSPSTTGEKINITFEGTKKDSPKEVADKKDAK